MKKHLILIIVLCFAATLQLKAQKEYTVSSPNGTLELKIITEDTNSGYDFFKAVASDAQIFSWERYFTRLLIEKSSGTYFKYQKSTLNPVYLHEKNRNLLLNSMEGMDIGRRNQCL